VIQLAFSNDPKTKNFFASQTFYVLLLASGLLPLVVKKELRELKIASVILFLGVASFILIFIIQLIVEGVGRNNKDSDYG